ncbi:otogelin isoform X9 [Rhineura floridana]|uniref:otogelin isoform X9 n=1 Tax=Rhineura floridana TaxID=261503 RepID=UPI002AC86089|nr:otogelin isoform X9 [Rhineura floridana]
MEPRFRRVQVLLLYVWIPQALFSWSVAAQPASRSAAPGLARNSRSAVLQKGDPSALGEQVFGTSVYNSSSTTISSSSQRRFRNTICESSDSFTCFNGGECVHWQLCDCSRYNATGSRCQIVYNTGTERDNICRTWGQYHYETFDGLYYFFSGKSTYALVRQNELDEQSFSIQVQNDPECKSSPYSCKRSISLYFSGDGEIRLTSKVTYKGIGIQLPYTIGNLYIQKLAGYVIVRHQYAFSLAWDGISAAYIKMAPAYVGKTHGLCGNNNAILQDELATSHGKLTDDIEEFVESWRENPPQENILSWDTSFNYEPPCLTQSQAFLQRTYTLCSMLLWPPFRVCHEFVSPFPFMASCTNDLCMSAADNATWCRALTEYARTCAQAGKPLHEWRARFQECVVKCEEHLVYNECIDCCPVSCQQKTHCVDSELPCVDGCYCPDGLIYENKLCVRPTECPCDYHGTIHRTGAVIHEECNNCTCTGGKWICTNFTCPAECSVSGDIHFMTFDGRKYSFQATCQYILAKSLTSGKFAVTLQNAHCGQNQDETCIQSVSLILNQDFKRQVTLTHSGDVLVYDQYKVNLPYVDDAFEIRKLSSVFLQIKSYIGLQILYDWKGLRLYLKVDAQWKDDTVGLCGTFNGNTQDDFLSPVGVPESTPHLFGNSWKTSSACGLEHDYSPIDPCDVHLQAATYATEVCSIITKDLFVPCHSYLSPLPYFEQCRRDTCKCGQICMCSALSHYAHLCHRYGVVVDFRSNIPECALSCEDTKEYSTCVSTCGKSCQAFSVPETCSDDCVEGCTCPSGMYMNIKTDRCVQQNECPCYFQGIDYSPGENIITSLGKCHCRDGIMNCEENNIVHDCPDDQIYVNCSNPQTMELGRERTCENQLLNLTVSAHLPCFSGCMCPHGLVKHGDACFKLDECPCSWKGKEYFPGDKVISSCHTCICHHGSFECTFHPCPSMCTTYGDRHYRTFDGLSFDYIGNCKVYLVKSSSITSFSIITENINCFNTGIICRKYIFINVGKSFIIFDDDTGDPSPLSYIDKLQQIHIWKAGFFTLVHLPNEHITITWDQRTTVHVETGPQWQGVLTGLCGNFDSKTINEMRTPENFELTNAQEFGSSWAAVECVDSSDIRHPCILNPLREPFAKKECGILLSEIFESCHQVVDVTWFYSNCLTDTCGCNQGGDCECFCTSVSAYAHQCCQQGVTVDWRSPRLCPYDCEYINKVLGKGPYKLVSFLDREIAIGAKLLDGSVFPARGDGLPPGDAVHFMLTSGLYKPKAHDPNLVSFEAADRPNYFLHLASNNTLVLSKYERSEHFQNRSTFAIHKNTWLSGYSSFESFAVLGAFIHISASSVNIVKYHHSEAFRLSTLFKLEDNKFKFLAHTTCEWRYDVCTSPCFKTCRDPLAEHCQTVPKVEGCVPMCPSHMVLDEVTQRCVYFEDCRCTLFSDLSFITFDGHHLALFKEASYIVSQTQDETISIHISDCKNTHMGILTSTKLCLAMLNLTYTSNQIIIDRLNRKIAVNSRYAWPTVRKYGFKIEDNGFMYIIETPTNIRIQWFHTTGMMVIELNTTNDPKAMGLCGFCDGISANELMLPSRTVVSTVGASVVFTDSWQVPNTLKYIGEQRSHETNCSVTDCSLCLNMLLNQTFSSCHPYVSPDSFCDLWVQDKEYIQNPCIALAAYVAMCNKFNICIEWRSSDYCSFPCPEDFSYKACISACDTPSTCQNMEPVRQDSDSCLILTEGCVCAEGTILHRIHSALCIPEEKCACTDISGVPHALGETWKTSHSGCCMHKCVDNETIVPVEYNCSVNNDLECHRFGEVALIAPDDQSCCQQKVCTCNQSLCETFIPECKGLEKLAAYYRDDSCCPNYSCECDPAKCESMEQIPNCRADQTLIAAHVEGTCCISYICACGICSDQIPECQEGEVLTVEGNATDRCCPTYQCICETYRCPEFKCVLGMSLVEVWSPEKCCPYRTCECACETIPKPQCKLGEKLIIDEQFQNSTENVCHCTNYKCSRDKVCLSNERGILLPGQSIVEHSPDGVCHTSYCTNIIDPVTKYYRINISTIDCAARCKSVRTIELNYELSLNQVYEPPKDLITCCGKCKNVSCVYSFNNGTVSHFKPGTSWISNCVRYDCTNTPFGPVLITSSISCPPFNETECVKVGGYIVPFLEGCCKTCKEDGKFCKKVTVRMTIRKNDCRSNTPVNIVSCDGKCPSASIYNYNINTYARFCKCCRELGLHRRNVQLYCSGNSTWVSYTIQEPTDCSCQWS